MLWGRSLGETRTIEITVDDPRPLAAAILKLEELSGIPINYEDMPVYYSDDMRDVTDEVAQRPVPPGGSACSVRAAGSSPCQLRLTLPRESLIDLEAVNTALAALVSAYNASDLPGDFDMEGRNGVFFVMPVRYRDATGTTQPMTPILSTPITLPEERRGWIQTIRLILGQVSAATGVEIGPNILKSGMCDRRSTKTNPAYHLIARMLAHGNGTVPAAANSSWDSSFSYLFFCQPGFGCALNDWRARLINTKPRTPRERRSPYPCPART